MATLTDVARRAGLSPMTASRVFSGRGTVSDAARARVLAAAAELDYSPNEVARSLRSSRSNLVSLIVSDIENSFFAAIAKSAERALAAAGYRLMISSSDEDGAQELALLAGVGQMRADALLITPTPHNREALDRMRRAGLPIVQLDRALLGLASPSVLLDNALAAGLAVDHLHERGHRDITLISGPLDLTTGRERADGARAAAERHGDVTLRVVEAPSFMHEASVETVLAALPLTSTAVVAGNNIVLEACFDAFTRSGVDVPGDVALVGFDDLPWMSWVRPSITAVRQPVEAIAGAAVECLLARLDHGAGADASPQPVRLAPELVVRGSTPYRDVSNDDSVAS